MATYEELRSKYGLSDSGKKESGGSEYNKLRESYGLSGSSGKDSSYADLRARYGLIRIDDNPDDYINSYFRNIDQFYRSGVDRYHSIGFGNSANGAYTDFRDTASRYRIQENNIRYFLKNHQAEIDPDYYDAIISDLDSYAVGLQSLQDSYKSASDYYGQWGSQAEYDSWTRDYEAQQEAQRQNEQYRQNQQRMEALLAERDRLQGKENGKSSPYLDAYNARRNY